MCRAQSRGKPSRDDEFAELLGSESVDEAALMGGRARTLSEDVDALIVPHDGLLPSLSVPALFWRHGGFLYADLRQIPCIAVHTDTY